MTLVTDHVGNGSTAAKLVLQLANFFVGSGTHKINGEVQIAVTQHIASNLGLKLTQELGKVLPDQDRVPRFLARSKPGTEMATHRELRLILDT